MTDGAHRHLLSLGDLDDASLDGLLQRAARFAGSLDERGPVAERPLAA